MKLMQKLHLAASVSSVICAVIFYVEHDPDYFLLSGLLAGFNLFFFLHPRD